MNTREKKIKTSIKAYYKTFLLLFIPLVLISLAIFFFFPYLQNRSIASGCERLFEDRAVEFFLKGGLSDFLNEQSKKAAFFDGEFDILGIYVWNGHWISIYRSDEHAYANFKPADISEKFTQKRGIYFWQGNRKALEANPPIYYAAEFRGGKLYLLSARLTPEYVEFVQIIPKKHLLKDILILIALSIILALGAMFLMAAFVQGYALRLKRSAAAAEFDLPTAPYVGLEEVGTVALKFAKSAYEARQQKRNILLQKQSEFESERRDFSIIREIAQTTVAAPDLRTAASEALIPLIRRTGVRCGAIFQAKDRGKLRLVGENNLPADLAEVLSEMDSETPNLKMPSEASNVETVPIQKLPGAEGNPILSLQDEGLTHTLCLSLIIEGDKWGVIHLYNAGPIQFDERLKTLLLTTAEEIALILENKRLLVELDERIKESLSYYEFSKTLISTNDFDMLLENILWLIHEFLDVPFCSVLLVNEEDETLDVKAIWGYGQEHNKMRLPMGEGLTGWAVEHAEAALAKDVSQDSRYMEGFSWVTSELAVPLIADGKVIGVLDCESNETHQIDEKDLRFLSSVADPIALAIKRALHYTEMSRQLVLDPVTDLYNRRYFDNLIERNGEQLLLRHGKISVAFISISNLSKINNTYGYLAGDIIVKQVAKMLKNLFPEGIISRYGLSEFLVLLPGVGEEAMLRMVEELRGLREQWLEKHPDSLPISFSQGYATTDRYDELRNLLHRADSRAAEDRRENDINNFRDNLG